MGKRTSYEKGVETERKVCKRLDEAGYVTFRSAGSGGAFDVCALGPTGVRFIQVKRVNKDANPFDNRFETDIEILEELKKEYGRGFISFELWVWKDYKGFQRKVLV